MNRLECLKENLKRGGGEVHDGKRIHEEEVQIWEEENPCEGLQEAGQEEEEVMLMVCGKGTMKWRKAMAIARRNYPGASLERRRRIAAAITRKKKRR